MLRALRRCQKQRLSLLMMTNSPSLLARETRTRGVLSFHGAMTKAGRSHVKYSKFMDGVHTLKTHVVISFSTHTLSIYRYYIFCPLAMAVHSCAGKAGGVQPP